ncbi:hypothetical protein [[Clostridium] innocuum]|uniref:hypothetical protein n=1 Tax=Clostridium innocuum TaxID=1522 RepID=UPI001F5AE04C|nr:hypothetical protein [[Clostridium] innocuum]MCI2978679.1 hypothetical protein [[Clostridium] innocuum]MCI3022510.1 hypothetical protein [[Clostridium] innocuum]MCI3022919.1 hypothetical protein [[Clostridium] innocuum]MCR0193847.1 hypothetical protein [[Clostridium] innocuum]MCR0280393.1 hypothetical protein [[Clostridium] innocuum]
MEEISYAVGMLFSIVTPVVTIFIMKGYYRNKCTYEVDGVDIAFTLVFIVASIICGAFIGTFWYIVIPSFLIGAAVAKFIFPDKIKTIWKNFKEMVMK